MSSSLRCGSRPRLVATLLLCLSAVPLPGQGSDVFLVTDLNDRGVVAPYPLSDFLRAGDAAVLVQETPEAAELWVTDGTAAGTRRLPTGCDPCSGLELLASDGSQVFFFGDGAFGLTDGTPPGTRTLLPPGTVEEIFLPTPRRLGDNVFFGATDAETGSEPWVTDGTPEGTRRLLDIAAGSQGSRPRFGAAVDGAVLFVAEDELDGDGLWRTDGTPEGTRRLMDLDGGVGSNTFIAPLRLGDRILFFADPRNQGTELWLTDGTPAGTRPVSDLGGSVLVHPLELATVGDLLFFKVFLGLETELWRSDGTPEGTRPVRRFETALGALLGGAGNRLVFEERTFIPTRSTLWSTDGTPDGTFALGPVCEPFCDPPPRRLAELGEHLFFDFRDSHLGVETWVTDGTVAGTRPVADLCPGVCSSDPELVVQAPDALYLAAGDPLVGRELYRVQAGAPPVRLTSFVPLDPFARVTFPLGLVRSARRPPSQGLTLPRGALFAATEPEAGFSLYLTRDTAESTQRVVELAPADNAGSQPRDLTGVGGELVFTATDGILPRRLWQTDGSADATLPLELFSQSPEDGGPFEPGSVAPYEEGYLVWVRDPSNRFALWRWTPGGLMRLVDDLPGASVLRSSPPPSWIVAGERIFFTTQDPPDTSVPGLLWVSQGTPETTRVVREFTRILDRQLANVHLERLGDRLVFLASAERGTVQGVWISDGTEAGTKLVFEEPRPPLVGLVDHLVVAGERIFVVLLEEGRARWLVIDDPGGGGAAGKARELASFERVSDSLAVGSMLYFLASEEGARELWVSDGTKTGTQKLADVGVERFRSRFRDVEALNGTVFFLDEDRILATDGTPGGTRPLDVLPASVRPTGLDVVGNLLWIETGGPNETRVWVSQGGAEPARRLEPGFTQIDRSELTVVDALAFFPADDGETGRELWALDLTAPPPIPCQPGPGTLCLTNDRFRVVAEWRDPRSGSSGRGLVVPSLLDDSGFFWFFDEDNVELVVKVLDARPVNGHFWFFSGSLTDVERRITVTDTVSGITRTYERGAGDPTGHIDVTAF